MAKGFFKSERTVSPTATGAYGSSSSSHPCGQATGGDSFRAAAEKKRGGRRSRGRHARTTDNSGRCAANAAPKRRRKGSVRRTASGLWGLSRRLGRQQGPDIDKTTHSSRPARRHRSARALHQSTPGIEQEVSVLSRDNTGNTIIAAFKAAIATQGVGIAFKSIQSTEAMPMSTWLSHPRGRGRSSSRGLSRQRVATPSRPSTAGASACRSRCRVQHSCTTAPPRPSGHVGNRARASAPTRTCNKSAVPSSLVTAA